MLEPALKEQLKGIFAGLEADFTFDISVSASHESRAELLELLSDVAECSDHITCMVNEGSGLKFTIGKNGKPTEITLIAQRSQKNPLLIKIQVNASNNFIKTKYLGDLPVYID